MMVYKGSANSALKGPVRKEREEEKRGRRE